LVVEELVQQIIVGVVELLDLHLVVSVYHQQVVEKEDQQEHLNLVQVNQMVQGLQVDLVVDQDTVTDQDH
jgi:hypothetical protein